MKTAKFGRPRPLRSWRALPSLECIPKYITPSLPRAAGVLETNPQLAHDEIPFHVVAFAKENGAEAAGRAAGAEVTEEREGKRRTTESKDRGHIR